MNCLLFCHIFKDSYWLSQLAPKSRQSSVNFSFILSQMFEQLSFILHRPTQSLTLECTFRGFARSCDFQQWHETPHLEINNPIILSSLQWWRVPQVCPVFKAWHWQIYLGLINLFRWMPLVWLYQALRKPPHSPSRNYTFFARLFLNVFNW